MNNGSTQPSADTSIEHKALTTLYEREMNSRFIWFIVWQRSFAGRGQPLV
jgi:hypothetical protein